jgi:hypothetical protein
MPGKLIRLPGERDVYEVMEGPGCASKFLLNRTAPLRQQIASLESRLAGLRQEFHELTNACPTDAHDRRADVVTA